YPDKIYLYNFFENLLLKESHSLQNRQMLLWKNNESDHVNDKNDHVNDQNDHINDHVNQFLIDIISLLEDDPKLTINELGKKLNVSPKTISRRITQLKSMKKIERIGSPKTGYWKIL
ncbi:MAG: Lrp/AsnC family transcriptional regulator, partial [Bacillota bacterium]